MGIAKSTRTYEPRDYPPREDTTIALLGPGNILVKSV